MWTIFLDNIISITVFLHNTLSDEIFGDDNYSKYVMVHSNLAVEEVQLLGGYCK